ncbi:hypothetical protein ACIQTT_10425 [Microbacterium sp. NPDC090225]|uniref:hypothetical protein n=1 Tax=Microbacterium sp. NPDC090225 TaxID=3364207 RepID=UPI003822EF7B
MNPRRMLLTPWLIRACIPDGTVGTYTLWDSAGPVYIGRSDTCLRRRLLEHAAKWPVGIYFTFDVSHSVHDAFTMECSLFHALGDTTTNIDHPPRPRLGDPPCPFCASSFHATRGNRLQMAPTKTPIQTLSTTSSEGHSHD